MKLLSLCVYTVIYGISQWFEAGMGLSVPVLHDKQILSGLLITFFWITGYQVVFTYISPFLRDAARLSTTKISAALLVCGIFAVIGSRFGGYSADKWGVHLTLLLSLLIHAVALIVLPWVATTFIGALVILASWVGFAWTTTPAQQYFLVSLSPNSSGLVLGLNNSVLQFGMAVGAGTGGWIINQTSIMNIGWVGAISIIIGLLATFYSFSLKDKQLSGESHQVILCDRLLQAINEKLYDRYDRLMYSTYFTT